VSAPGPPRRQPRHRPEGGPGLLGHPFAEVHRHRPRALLAPFVQHDRHAPATAQGLTRLDPGPPAPFCAIELDVVRRDPAAGLLLGLAGDAVAVLARWTPAAGDRPAEVSIEVVRDGRTTVAAAAPALPGRAGRLAFVLHENQVTVLSAAPRGDWHPLLTERDAVRALVDLRDPAVLGGLGYAWGTTGDGAVEVRRVRAGISGPVGVRDPQVVRRPDGRPLVRDGRLHLTMTSAGHGFFPQAHWSTWTMDLADPAGLVQVGALFSARDGLLLGDHAGHLVVDEDAGRTIVAVSSWGDHDVERGVHVRHLVSGEDLLTGVHVLPTARLDLPTGDSAWDPSLALVDGRWHVAFTECPAFEPRYTFHPALAVADGPAYDQGLRLIAADTAREQTEGTLLQRIGRHWYVLASDRDAAEYVVYDTALRQVGVLDAPYGSNIPHPVLVRAAGGPDAPWWMLTFDGTAWREDVFGYGTHGDLVVLATGGS
jgi:hypothetical protein